MGLSGLEGIASVHFFSSDVAGGILVALTRAHILIEGRVQGVFFRSSMKEVADRYGVKGWARNLPSGEVEALVEGESGAVDGLIEWCRQGPPAAAVDRVTVGWEQPKDEFTSFFIKR